MKIRLPDYAVSMSCSKITIIQVYNEVVMLPVSKWLFDLRNTLIALERDETS